MNATTRLFLGLGFLLLATGTTLGATGAHFLETRITPDRLAVYQQAVDFQFFQALGLIVIAGLAHKLPDSKLVKACGWLVIVGIALFSGSIYATTFGLLPQSMAFVAMFGGMAFQLAWLTLAIVVWFGKNVRT
ncbi:MAG: DUF423 domain-containing protein [Chromatiales bacterium]|nr:MAG: DUF423 domain-containing protein [Chromatiales bacterium]